MVRAYVALGANLGDAATALRQAVKAIDGLRLTRVKRASSIYKTEPLDSQPNATGLAAALGEDYLNAVIEVETSLPAPELLDWLQQLEQLAGRQRPYHNAPRTLDLDLLLYGSASISSPRLTVPHPRMLERAFVLVPLAEIALALVSASQLSAVAGQSIELQGVLDY